MVRINAVTFESCEKLWESVIDETNISDVFNKVSESDLEIEYAEGNTGLSISKEALDELNNLKKTDYNNLAEFDKAAAILLWEKLLVDDEVNLRVQLSDRRIWTDLTFNHLSGLVVERWGESNGNKVVETRLFILGEMTSGKLIRHSISRLWWYAHLCRDENNSSNPWHLLSILCDNTEVQLQLTDRQISHNENVLKTILRYLERDENRYLLKGDKSKSLGKWLIAYSGITELTILNESEINFFLDKIKNRISPS